MGKINLVAVTFCVCFTVSCNNVSSTTSTTAVEDTSASGAAAAAAGGALSDSAGGTLAFHPARKSTFSYLIPDALASACPTFATTGAGCTATGSSMWLTLSNCSFGDSKATWTGTKLLQMSTGTASCGTFPNPGASQNLIRQFVSTASSTTPGTMTRVNAFGSSVTLDDATANVGNFDGQTIAAVANGGYGTKTFINGSGARSSIQIARRYVSVGKFNHTVAGTLTVTEASSAATSRVLSGTIAVYHNLLRVVGSSVFNTVTHSDSCCVPVSGSITTTFAAGANVGPTGIGSAMIGRSEVLTFTGCGTGTLQAFDGSTSNVAISSCF